MALSQGYVAVPSTEGAVVRSRPAVTRTRRVPKTQWLLLAGLALAIGLGLRLASAQPLVSLSSALPWLQPPTVTVYFPDSKGQMLVPVTRRVTARKATPQGALEHLLRGPRDRTRLAAALAPGAQLTRFELQDGNALVEIAGELSPMAQVALARTLQDFSEVKSVQVVSPSVTPMEGSMPRLHPVYYAYGSYLVPVLGPVESPGEALQRYLAGPEAGSGLVSLPSDVRLLEYRLDTSRGLAYVNFTYTDSVRQLAVAEPTQTRRILIGIVATLTEFPQVRAVKLDFQGHTTLGLGQCSDLLRAPQPRPTVLNDEAKLATD